MRSGLTRCLKPGIGTERPVSGGNGEHMATADFPSAELGTVLGPHSVAVVDVRSTKSQDVSNSGELPAPRAEAPDQSSLATPNESHDENPAAPSSSNSRTRRRKSRNRDVAEDPKRGSRPRLHRIREVRRQQGISIRTVCRRMGIDSGEARRQENEGVDLRVSELLQWQRCLDVPLADLLVECEEPLSRPVLERARMIRLMKTAASILERAPNPSMKRLAQMLVDQLVEIMPKLKDVGPWHTVGQRRSLDDLGRIVEKCISLQSLGGVDRD